MQAAPVLALAVVLAGCGGPSAGPDAGATADAGAADAAPAAGTWADPIEISGLPFLAAGDTRGAPALAARYDCAPAIDESGGEVVYRLVLAEATTLRLGVDDRAGDARDVDLHVVSGVPDETGAVAGCAARADLAIETDLAAGTWYVAIDSYAGTAAEAPYTLSIVRADPGECLVNPLPACTADDTPDVNGVPVEPPGLGGCPAGMTAIDDFCIDRWEAALVLGDAGWSPYANPAAGEVRAVSAPASP